MPGHGLSDGVDVAIFAVGAFLGGWVSGLSGFAMGLVVSGIWLRLLTPMQTAALIAGYGLLTQGFGIFQLRRSLELRKAWPLVAGTVVGIPIGAALLAVLDPAHLRLGVGILLALYAVYGLKRPTFPPLEIGTGADLAIGLSNGVLGGLTGLGGVISTISTQWRGWPKNVQRAVFQPVLFVAFVVITASQWAAGTYTRQTLAAYAIGLPFMVAGLWSGFRMYGRIDDEVFRRTILVLLFLSGASLAVPAFMRTL